MKRREFVERLGFGSAAMLAGGATVTGARRQPEAAVQHDDNQSTGPQASATVSFGQWMTPLDRFPDVSPIPANRHRLVPYVATIKAGGSVNFIIAGFHQVLVYAPGTQFDDINPGLTVMPTMPGPPLVNDPNRRVYRGLDPSLLPQDRVEVITLGEPGTYLVVCGVLPHFNDRMHGFARVLP